MMRAPRASKPAQQTPPSPAPERKPERKKPPVGRGRNPEFEVDLGARIRAGRVAARMSQTDLGQCVGISFQQMQKYEKGKDRVAVSTLRDFAAALGVHPGSFFDDMPAPAGGIPDVKAAMRCAERIQRVRDPAVSKRLMALIDVLASTDGDAGEARQNGTGKASR